MSDDVLNFGNESWDQAKSCILSTLRQHHQALHGNGKPGVMMEVSDIKLLIGDVLGQLKGIMLALKLAAWIISICILVIGVWLTSLEVRHMLKIGGNDPGSVIQLPQQPSPAKDSVVEPH